jgi:protocatechuate 3,4-dioxygenase beta subunit
MKRVWIALLVVAIAVVAYVWPRERSVPRSATVPAQVAATPVDVSGKKRDPKTLAAATVSGTVHDDARKPLAGARVCVVGEEEEQRCAESDSGGRFALAGVIADDVQLGTQLAKFRPRVIDVLSLAPGETRTVEIELVGGGVELRGVVEDILGGPIEHAQVSTEGVRVDTDAQGRFAIWISPAAAQGLPPSQIQMLHARATGYGPRSQALRSLGPVVIALSPESTITGKVVDAASGAPVASARVVATPGGEATSSADGSFALEGLAAGDIALEAITPQRFGSLPGQIQLGLGMRVEGIVVQVYPARTVVATVEVEGDRLHCNPTPRLSDWSMQVAKPWRDEDGRYHFDGLPPGVYTPALGCGEPLAPITVGDHDVAVTWKVATGGTVKGKIVLAQQYPRQRTVDISLVRTDARRVPIVRTDNVDRFELRGVPAGTYTLTAKAEIEMLAKLENIVVANGATVERDITAALENRGKIAGTVTYKGKPVNAGVILQNVRGLEAVRAQAVNGRFESDVPEGNYHVSAYGPAHGKLEDIVSVAVGKTATVALVLDKPMRGAVFDSTPTLPPDEDYSFSGRVVDETNAPVANAVVIADSRGLWRGGDTSRVRVSTGDDGTFAFSAKSSTVNTEVFRIGGVIARPRIDAGTPQTIVLARDGTISGTVSRPDGSAANRFQVRVGRRTENFDHTGGRFTVRDAGTYPLVLTAIVNGIAGEPVTITQSSAKTNVALKLPATVTVTGRIVDGETREGIAFVKLAVRKGGGGWASWFIHSDQITDENGRFMLRELPPGPVMLELSPPVDSWSGQTVNVTVPDKHGDLGEFGLAQARKR